MTFAEELDRELEIARARHSNMRDALHALEVIRGELWEIEQEARRDNREPDMAAIRADLVSVAAMALRTIQDLKLPPAPLGVHDSDTNPTTHLPNAS